jgi:osmotically-inducible protein OsmY
MRTLSLLPLVLALVYATGCPQMAIVTGATTVASAVADDRTLEQQTADLGTKASIEKALLETAPSLASAVNVDVYLGRIMLTGVVPDWSARRLAVTIARGAAPNQEIFDDIEVATGQGFADSATNFAVNKELGVNLLADQGLASQSLQHRVVNGTAFIIGEATSPGVVDTARQVALQTPGVQRVVTHIIVR